MAEQERTFGVFSPDGTCLDANGKEWENLQLVDTIKARDVTEALDEARDNLEAGAYEGFEYLYLRELGASIEIDEGAEE